MYRAIHIVGGPGSGCSTLGNLLAIDLGLTFLDGDDFYWLPTTPPFQEKLGPDARAKLVLEAVQNAPHGFVFSGSVAGWGEVIENLFDAIILLSLPTALRLERIEAREIGRYGRIDPDFLEWAGQYDEGRLPGRSRDRHEAWLQTRTCPVFRQDSSGTDVETLQRIVEALKSTFEAQL